METALSIKEKSSQFLGWFWDLAAEDTIKRISAAENIVKHLKEQASNLSSDNKSKKTSLKDLQLSSDGSYAIKRYFFIITYLYF
jgi:hypothetical protein